MDETPCALATTAEFWPRATLLPATPDATLAIEPTTVLPETPLSVAWLPTTVEFAPAAFAPNPTAAAFEPVAVGCAEVIEPSETATPAWPDAVAPACAAKADTDWFVAFSCEPFTASVDKALTRPAATFVIWRSDPTEPTDTAPTGAAPA